MSSAIPNHFWHVALKCIPKHSIPFDIIAYPPCQSFRPTYFNAIVNSTTASAITTFLDLFSAVRPKAVTLAPLYTTPARISRLFQSASPAIIVNCSVLSLQATTRYLTPLFAFPRIFRIFAPFISSLRVLIHLLHAKEALAWISSRVFALGRIFNSIASLRPRKPDKHLLDSGHTFSSTKRWVGSFKIDLRRLSIL